MGGTFIPLSAQFIQLGGINFKHFKLQRIGLQNKQPEAEPKLRTETAIKLMLINM
jgi:hypothetical protein